MRRPLTDRELVILRSIAEGRTNEQIALDLRFSVRTVTGNLSEMFVAMGARSRAHAVHLAWQAGILTRETT